MATSAKIPITSSELGTLWMTFQARTMMLRMVDYFISKTDNEEEKNILTTYINDTNTVISEITRILKEEGSVIPVGFIEQDVDKNAPPLYDQFFHIMFLRILSKIMAVLEAVHLGISFRKDIREFYQTMYTMNAKTYNMCTDYLLGKGVLACPPNVSMPKEVEYIEDTKYMSGFNPFTEKRSLNTIEASYLFNIIESNVMGTQLMTGFAQVARKSELRDFFIQGKELAKKLVADLGEILQESDVQVPTTWTGRATDSTVPPFSDKLMAFCTNFLTVNSVGMNSLGTSFSMRADLPAKLLVVTKDTYDYAAVGGKILVKHKWLEEPPQMEDRNQLTKPKE